MPQTQQAIDARTTVDGERSRAGRRRFAAFRTRNAKLLFAILFGLGLVETLWIMMAGPFTGDLAFDLGFALGWLLVGGSIDAAVAGIVTISVVGVYHAGRRILNTVHR